MYIFSFDANDCACRIEVFIFQLTDATAIQRVGEICVKFVHIEEIHTLAAFFTLLKYLLLIGGKGDANSAMGNFGMCEKIFCGSENFSNACFIIRAKQGGAV